MLRADHTRRQEERQIAEVLILLVLITTRSTIPSVDIGRNVSRILFILSAALVPHPRTQAPLALPTHPRFLQARRFSSSYRSRIWRSTHCSRRPLFDPSM